MGGEREARARRLVETWVALGTDISIDHTDYDDLVRAIAAALDDGWQPPAGWKLVPEEATLAMEQAAWTMSTDSYSHGQIYTRMLAVAPPPPDRSEG